jgi:hypothetical protein
LRLPWVLPAERFGPVADLDAAHLHVLAALTFRRR